MTLLNNDEFKKLSNVDLIIILERGLLLERGRALFEIARRSGKESILIERVVNEIRSPKNINSLTIGIVSISFLGIAGLIESQNEKSKEIANRLIEEWAEPNRTQLLDFLRSSSLLSVNSVINSHNKKKNNWQDIVEFYHQPQATKPKPPTTD